MKIDIMGLAGIIIGAILSIYFYVKSLKVKQPYWAIRSNNLIRGWSGFIENLEIKYKNEPIENLTISKIAFWNNGKETIDRDDLQTINPLRIVAKEDVKILSVSVIENNNISSEFNVTIENQNNYAIMDFTYLDAKQGAVIQVVHTGMSTGDIFILGDIKGVKKISKRTTSYDNFVRTKKTVGSKLFWGIFLIFSLLLGLASVALGFLNFFPSINENIENIIWYPFNYNGSSFVSSFICIVLGSILLLPPIALLQTFRLIPKDLELFYSEMDFEE